MFVKWGSVGEVFILPKKDKFGRTFSFVRFKDVKNIKWLECMMDSIWIGSYKLRVNLPKFERGIYSKPEVD